MTSVQTILSAAFPAGIPPERYAELPEITQAARLLAGFTEEPELEGLAALFAGIPDSKAVKHPEFRPKHPAQATPESQEITAQIIDMRDNQGLKWREIAKLMNLTEEATRKRYRAWKEKEREKVLLPSCNSLGPGKQDEIDAYIITCRVGGWLDQEIAQGIQRNYHKKMTAQQVGDRARELAR